MIVTTVFIITVTVLIQVSGHGMMLEPASRSSMWRTHSNCPINYDDNGNCCGGFAVSISMLKYCPVILCVKFSTNYSKKEQVWH